MRTPSCYNLQLKKKELDHDDEIEYTDIIEAHPDSSMNIPFSTEPHKQRLKKIDVS